MIIHHYKGSKHIWARILWNVIKVICSILKGTTKAMVLQHEASLTHKDLRLSCSFEWMNADFQQKRGIPPRVPIPLYFCAELFFFVSSLQKKTIATVEPWEKLKGSPQDVGSWPRGNMYF